MEQGEYTKDNEGYRDTVYDDANGTPIRKGSYVEGHPTIGWGINLEYPMSEEALSVEFRHRYGGAMEDARSLIPCFEELDLGRKVAFVDMAYHLGREGLAGFKKMIGNIPAAVSSGYWEEVVEELMDSKYAQIDTPERAERNATMILEGSE